MGRTATLDAARRCAAVRKPDEPDWQFTTPLRTRSLAYFHEQPPAGRLGTCCICLICCLRLPRCVSTGPVAVRLAAMTWMWTS